MSYTGLVERLREVAPRRVDGQSSDFAFRMDGISLIDLNRMVNEAADAIEALTRPVDVEAVARAMCNAAWLPVGESWGHASDEQRAEFSTMAQAALAAMEAPHADG